MTKKKLLFASEVFPYPLDRGDRVRISHILAACAREYDVTFIGPKPSDGPEPIVPSAIGKVVLYDPTAPIPFSISIGLAAVQTRIGLPISSNFFRRLRFLYALKGVNLDEFDVIWAERPDVGVYFSGHRHRTIVDYDDITHRKMLRLLPIQHGIVRRLHTWYQALVYRHAELTRFRGYKQIVVCSEEDASYLRSHGVAPVAIVRNGVSFDSPPQDKPARTPGTPLRAVFLGNMAHAPNIDALRYCVEEILPRTGSSLSKLDVIGSNASPELKQELGNRVHFRGFVDDVGAALQEYDVMLAPLRFGSGTKLKLLEAMAANLPIVTTDIGAEGLMLENEVSAMIVNTPEEMASALQRLADDSNLGRRTAENARQLMERNFMWSSITKDIGELLR